MNGNTLYVGSSILAAIPWFMLIFFPRAPLTQRITGSAVFSLGFALLYTVLILMFFRDFLSAGGYRSIDSVRALFQSDAIFLAAWIHYLAFDLLIGTWESRDAMRRQIPYGFVQICLLFTYLFGPIGWLCYVAFSRIKTREWPSWHI